jgi:hypothetical protein
MPRLDPLTDEALEIVADNDRLEMFGRHVRHALTAALRELAWPRSLDVAVWRDQALSSRLEAANWAAKLQHPRRLSGIHLQFLYKAAAAAVCHSR